MNYAPGMTPEAWLEPLFEPVPDTAFAPAAQPLEPLPALNVLTAPIEWIGVTARAVLGDRHAGPPAIRCEIGHCPGKAPWVYRGEKALSVYGAWTAAEEAGWRLDWIGRRVCPWCQRTRYWRPPASCGLPALYDAVAAREALTAAIPVPAPAAEAVPAVAEMAPARKRWGSRGRHTRRSAA